MVKAHYDGNDAKAWLWFRTRNPAFGMFSPLDMLKLGRAHKVMNAIEEALAGKRSL